MSAPSRVVRAGGPLAEFNLAGVLSAADVHVALRLAGLAGERDERVLLAAALAVRGVRAGSVCLFLDEREALVRPEAEDGGDPVAGTDPAAALQLPDAAEWSAAIAASVLAASGVLHLEGSRLYLERYWREEELVRAQVHRRLADPVTGIDPLRLAAVTERVFAGGDDAEQRQAAALAAGARLCVVTGGPGTGKTTTVARLLAVLHALGGARLRVALAAPTGKAAARLQQAVRAAAEALPDADRARVGQPAATTIHRLLGRRPGSRTGFAHDRDHHLPHDVVVVDETSMMSLPLTARLLEAVSPRARLVLVGDPDQLASVEAGAVLGDLVANPALAPVVVRLTTVHRHGGVIAELARQVRAGDADRVLALLREGGESVEFVEPAGTWPSAAEIEPVRRDAVRSGRAVVAAARAGNAGAALTALDSHRLLLAHRRGPYGVAAWASRVEAWLASAGERTVGPWYPGRPLIVTANDREVGLYNGDVGVVVRAEGAAGDGLMAAFADPEHPVLVRPHRLPPVETVHAMTVHRAQGSEFGGVSVVLPPPSSPLLTRELLYTALTRARERLRVVGSEAAVRAALARPVRRASGLRHG